MCRDLLAWQVCSGSVACHITANATSSFLRPISESTVGVLATSLYTVVGQDQLP